MNCAIEILGTEGASGLTHRAIDHRLGFPEGTTSNYFRTKLAILEAAQESMWKSDMEEMHRILEAAADDRSSVASGSDVAISVIEAWMRGEGGRLRQRARMEIQLLAPNSDELWLQARNFSTSTRDSIARFLDDMGLQGTEDHVRILQALGNGLILDRVLWGREGSPLSADAIKQTLTAIFESWK